MPVKTIKEQNLQWIHIDRTDDDSINFLKQNFSFHHLDFEDLVSEQQTPKIDVYKNYLFLVLHFPHWNGELQTIIPQEVDIFLGDGYFITIQNAKSKEIKNFFYRCMNNKHVKDEWMSGSSGYLLYRFIEALFHDTRPVLNNIGKNISSLEQRIFAGNQDTTVIKQLALLRRNVLSFRRVIDPERYLIANLSHTRKSFLDESLSLYFDDVTDYLSNIWTVVDNYQEIIKGLHITVESLLNRRINKTISTLTVISVSLLPFSVLSGIYGMNIALPFAERPSVIWGLYALLATIIVSFIFIMKKRKWL
ncbi:MAG: magnesium transporter CorA family protein [Patescibacteria group bacterium]